MAQTDDTSQLRNLLETLHTGQPVLFIGAGVSIDPPACLPNWYQMRDWTLEAIASQDDSLASYLPLLEKQEVIAAPGQKGISPEVVAAMINRSCLKYSECFKVFDRGEPNENHHWAALLAKHGYIKYIVTTNFDTFIERALEQHHVEFSVLRTEQEFKSFPLPPPHNTNVYLLKLHGCITVPDTIVATVEKEARGLSYHQSIAVRWLIQHHPIVFWGYSGADLKINLDYFGMVSLAPTSPGFYWSFYQTDHFTEPINPFVQQLADQYDQARATIGHMLIPRAAKTLVGSKVDNIDLALKETGSNASHDAELLEAIKGWASEHVNPSAAYTIFADLLSSVGLDASAVACYEKGLALSKENSHTNLEINMLRGLAKVYISLRRFLPALRYLQLAETKAIQSGDMHHAQAARILIGDCYRLSGRIQQAISNYEAALLIISEQQLNLGTTRLLLQLGDSYITTNQYEKAKQYAKQAELLCRQQGNWWEIMDALRQLGTIDRVFGNFDSSEKYFSEAEQIAQVLNDHKQIFSLRYYKATILFARHNYNEARALLHEVIRGYAGQYPIRHVDALYLLYIIENNLKNYSEARRILDDLITSHRHYQDGLGLAKALLSRASHEWRTSPDQALSDAYEAATLADEVDSYLLSASAYGLVGRIMQYAHHQPEAAVTNYLLSISRHRQAGVDQESWVVGILPHIHICHEAVLATSAEVLDQIINDAPFLRDVIRALEAGIENQNNFSPDEIDSDAHADAIDPALQQRELHLFRIMRKAQLNAHEAIGQQNYDHALKLLNLSRKLAHSENYYQQEAAVLSDIGWAHILQEQFSEGLSMLKQSSELSIQYEDFGTAISSMGNMGYALGRMGEYSKSLEYLDRAIELAHQYHDREMELRMTLEQANWCKEHKEPRASVYFTKALNIVTLEGDYMKRAEILMDLALTFYESQEYDHASDYLLQGRNLLRQINTDSTALESSSMLIGIIYEDHFRKPKMAIDAYEIGLGYAVKHHNNETFNQLYRLHKKAVEKLSNSDLLSYPVYEALLAIFGSDKEAVYHVLGITAMYEGFPQEIFEPRLYSRILEILRGNAPKAAGYVMEMISRYCMEGGRPKEAEAYLRFAQKIAEDLGDKAWSTEIMIQRANALTHMERLVEAIELFREADRLAELTDNQSLDYMLYTKLGSALLLQGDLEAAHGTLLKAVEISHQKELHYVEAEALMHLGTVLEQMQKPHDALVYYEHAYSMAQTTYDSTIILPLRIKLGVLLVSLEKPELALQHLEAIREEIEQKGSDQIKQILFQALAQAYSAINSNLAREYQEKANRQHDPGDF